MFCVTADVPASRTIRDEIRDRVASLIEKLTGS
jgi:hypothetical protein